MSEKDTASEVPEEAAGLLGAPAAGLWLGEPEAGSRGAARFQVPVQRRRLASAPLSAVNSLPRDAK